VIVLIIYSIVAKIRFYLQGILTSHISHIGKREVHTGFWWGDVREGDHLEDPGVNGRIILKWILKKWDGS
jgi:hypothetical protein